MKIRKPHTQQMNKYFTYCLNIHSNVELPLWPAMGNAVRQAPDIVINRTDSAPLSLELPDAGYECIINAEGSEIRSKYIGFIRVSLGHPVRMDAQPLPGTSDKYIGHFLSGSVLALAIYYHGFLPLHGCALQIHGRTVVFMGMSGMGKSSLCAALCSMGHRVINDDISPVDWINGKPHVMPGYPQIKINPDIANILGISRENLLQLHEIHPKSGWLRSEDRFVQPQSIDSLFFLGAGEKEIRRITGSNALLLLQRHATPSQWGIEGGKDHFLACSRLIRDVPAYAVIREHNLNALMDQAEWVSHSLQKGIA